MDQGSRHIQAGEIFLGQAILREATLDGHSVKTRDTEKALLLASNLRFKPDKRDDPNVFAHFLDACRAHDVQSIFEGRAQSNMEGSIFLRPGIQVLNRKMDQIHHSDDLIHTTSSPLVRLVCGPMMRIIRCAAHLTHAT